MMRSVSMSSSKNGTPGPVTLSDGLGHEFATCLGESETILEEY